MALSLLKQTLSISLKEKDHILKSTFVSKFWFLKKNCDMSEFSQVKEVEVFIISDKDR